MISTIQYAIADILLEHKWNDEDSLSAANVAFWRIMHHPYFNHGYDQYTLTKASDTFFQCVQVINEGDKTKSADPMHDWYDNGYWDDDDDNSDRVVFHHPKTNQQTPAQKSDIPQPIWEQSQRIIDILERNPSCVWLQDPRMRQQLTFEWCDEDNLNDRLQQFLGPYFHASLKQYGIAYHHPVRGGSMRQKQSPVYRYVVAHNNNEVAGVVGVLEYEKYIAMCYISTNHSFQRQGLSKIMYEMVVDECIAQQKILARTSPGAFTKEHPEITKSYDQLLAQRPVLYTPNDSRLLGFLLDKLQTQSYEQLVAQYHGACEDISRLQHQHKFQSYSDDAYVAQLRRQEQQQTNTRAMKAKV